MRGQQYGREIAYSCIRPREASTLKLAETENVTWCELCGCGSVAESYLDSLYLQDTRSARSGAIALRGATESVLREKTRDGGAPERDGVHAGDCDVMV